MAGMIIQQQVKDFAMWKKVFESNSELRRSGGELSHEVFQDANDPNRVTVINKWDSLENACKFAKSPELKAAMEEAGVTGLPTVTFLNEA